MTPSRLSFLPATAAALALLVAGCGGGGALSKSDLIAKADVICADAKKKIDGLGTPDSADKLKEFAGKASDLVKDQASKLKALEPPADVKADWDKAMGLLDKQVELAKKLADNADDPAKIQEVATEGNAINTEATAIAKKIGLKTCGT